MAGKNKLTGQEVVVASTSTTHADAVVTVTNKANAGITIYICGIILSASGTIAVAVAPTLTNATGGTLTLQLPASAIAPVALMFGVHPIKITQGQNAVLTLPDLGSGIIGTATLLYYFGEV